MNLDFNLAEQVKEEILQVSGWIYPLKVQYGIYRYSWQTYLIWRVIGTEHIFRIPLKQITANHGAKYTEHFILTLKQFREDFFEWKKLSLPEDWMINYIKQFEKFII